MPAENLKTEWGRLVPTWYTKSFRGRAVPAPTRFGMKMVFISVHLEENRFHSSRGGRARHSVPAAVVNLNEWVGNSGGQWTARPTSRPDYYREII